MKTDAGIRIEIFLSSIFASILDSDEKDSIAQHIVYLVSLADADLKSSFSDEIKALESHISSYNIVKKTTNESITSIYNKLKKNRLLIECHASAFVCAILKFKTYNQSEFDKYKIIILLCAIRLVGIGSHDSPVKSVLNELRYLANGIREELWPILPNPTLISFTHLINELNNERENESNSTSIHTQLSTYYVPLNNANKNSKGITRKKNKVYTKNGGNIEISPVHHQDEDDEHIVHEIRAVTESDKKRSQWEKEEQNSVPTDLQSFMVVKNHDLSVVEKRQRAIKANAIADRIKVRKQSLPCDFKILSAYEVSSLIKYCNLEIDNETDHYYPAVVIYLCLFFGRTYQDIDQMQKSKQTKFVYDQKSKNWTLKIKHKTSTFKQEYKVRDLITKVSDHLTLDFPVKFSNLLDKRFILKNVKVSDLQDFLSRLNRKNNLRLTLSRIANYFIDYHRSQNIDPVLLEVYLSLQTFQTSGMPYSNISKSSLLSIIQKYGDYLSDISDTDIFKLEQKGDPDKNENIGTPLLIQDKKIVIINLNHIAHLKELRTLNKPYIIDFHNKFVFYVYRMLTMASGFRPVTGTCGKLSDICLDSGMFWISDKENRNGISARCIVLGDIALKQLSFYLQHLKDLSSFFSIRNKVLYQRFIESLNAKEHLLFFIGDNDEIIEVTPTSINPYMDKQFPVKLNWHRHYIRSQFMRKNIDPALIGSFMGHEEIGQEGLGRFSSLSYCDFKKLSEVVNSILKSLNFKVVGGCKIR